VGGGTALAGGVDAGTRLCDITMGWMLAKAQALGLTFDPTAAAQYGMLPSEYAFDAIRDSWTALDGAAHLRPIAAGAMVANSVAVRVQYALTYLPGNLTLADGPLLGDGYSIVNVVNEGVVDGASE
jgi:hypothetical protein